MLNSLTQDISLTSFFNILHTRWYLLFLQESIDIHKKCYVQSNGIKRVKSQKFIYNVFVHFDIPHAYVKKKY